MERSICANGTVETFITDTATENNHRHFVKSVKREECCKHRQVFVPINNVSIAQNPQVAQSPGPVVKSITTPVYPVQVSPTEKPEKKPQERIDLKLGKIRVQIKHAGNVKVKESDGGLEIFIK